MYDIEKIHIYIHNLGTQFYINIDVSNEIVYINQKRCKYEKEKIKQLLNIIKLWDNNLNSPALDNEKIEITIEGKNFKENICAKTSNLKNYSEFKDWINNYE